MSPRQVSTEVRDHSGIPGVVCFFVAVFVACFVMFTAILAAMCSGTPVAIFDATFAAMFAAMFVGLRLFACFRFTFGVAGCQGGAPQCAVLPN